MTISFTSAGTTVSISASIPAPATEEKYEQLSWTEIGEVISFNEFGTKYAFYTFSPMDSDRVERRKSISDEGILELEMARIPTESGQAILKQALASKTNYSFKVVLNDDQGSGAGHSPTILYFGGLVGGYPTNVGVVDSITTTMVAIAVNTAIIEAARVDSISVNLLDSLAENLLDSQGLPFEGSS